MRKWKLTSASNHLRVVYAFCRWKHKTNLDWNQIDRYHFTILTVQCPCYWQAAEGKFTLISHNVGSVYLKLILIFFLHWFDCQRFSLLLVSHFAQILKFIYCHCTPVGSSFEFYVLAWMSVEGSKSGFSWLTFEVWQFWRQSTRLIIWFVVPQVLQSWEAYQREG